MAEEMAAKPRVPPMERNGRERNISRVVPTKPLFNQPLPATLGVCPSRSFQWPRLLFFFSHTHMFNKKNVIASEQDYQANQMRIQEAQTAVDNAKAANEEAKRQFDMEKALLQKVQEGRNAEWAPRHFHMFSHSLNPSSNFRAMLKSMMSGPSGSAPVR